jgi:hypothetical protein
MIWIAIVTTSALAAPRAGQNAAEDEPAERFVLVSRHAWFYQAPADDAPRFSLSAAPREDEGYAANALPYRLALVQRRGDWLEVRNPPPAGGHCVAAPRAIAPYALRLFVKRSAVGPVVRRAVVERIGRGLTARVVPGRWLKPGQRVVKTAGGKLRLKLAAADIGWFYTRKKPLPAALEQWIYYADSGDLVRRDRAGSRSGATHAVVAIESRPGRKTRRVTLRDRCVTYQRRLPKKRKNAQRNLLALLGDGEDNLAHDVLTSEPSGDGVAAAPAEPVAPVTLAAGQPLTWRDGSPAGRMRSDHSPDAEVEPAGERRCFAEITSCRQQPGLVGSADCSDPAGNPHLTICAAAEDL